MIIKSKKELKDLIEYEQKIYFENKLLKFKMHLHHNERYYFAKYLYYLRYVEYFSNKRSFFHRIKRCYYFSKLSDLGNKINVKIVPGYCGKGVNIHHKNIIINGYIGDNCIFHGNNCIGIKEEGKVSKIGDNLDMGYGASIIGCNKIGNNCVIGAGAVVVKSFPNNSILVGVPASEMSHQN